jgi:hypothetical protein
VGEDDGGGEEKVAAMVMAWARMTAAARETVTAMVMAMVMGIPGRVEFAQDREDVAPPRSVGIGWLDAPELRSRTHRARSSRLTHSHWLAHNVDWRRRASLRHRARSTQKRARAG